MRPERVAAGVLLAALLVGCASTGGAGADRPRRDVAEEMSRTGLANTRLAQNYLAAGKLDLALDRANRALRTDADSAELQVVLGMIYERLGDDARAGTHYARAGRLAPTDGAVLNALGVWLCRQGKADEAEARFAKAIADPFYKQREQAYANAGKCAADAGRLDVAEKHLRDGLAATPEDVRLLEQLVRVNVRQQDWMSARAFLQRREALGALGAEMLELGERLELGAGDAAAAARYRRQREERFPGHDPGAEGGQ